MAGERAFELLERAATPPYRNPLPASGEREVTEHLRRASRALISVSDKAGVVEFARTLSGYGIELVSTGGTRKTLRFRAIA